MSLTDMMLENGIKVTEPRESIAVALEKSTDHPDAELLGKRSGISTATVYRTLDLLHSHGLIREHQFGDGRIRYDIDTNDHHVHSISLSTGEVSDIEVVKFVKAISDVVGDFIGLDMVIKIA